MNYLSSSREDSEDDHGGETKEEANQKPTMFVSMGFAIHQADAVSRKEIENSVKTAFAPFSSDGKISIKSKAKLLPVSYSQAVNFFHIPTKANYSKGLEYTLYRKLPYPTNLSTPDNSDVSDLTVLGKTDYRAEKIEF